jgi:zinc transport system permease protein
MRPSTTSAGGIPVDNLMMLLAEAFRYDFITRALIVGSFIAVSCSFLGIFLVLKKLSLIGDGLAHVSFGSVAISLVLGASPLFFTIPLVVVASLLILRLKEKAKIDGDAAIGLVSASAVAIGVFLASKGQGFNIDLFSYLFGNILVIDIYDLYISIGLSILVTGAVILYYHDIFSVTFDEDFAAIAGIKSGIINNMVVILTAVTIAVGIRIVGAMLISSMIIFPVVTALQFERGFRQTIIIASFTSVFCVFSGIIISFLINAPSGATIVIMNSIMFMFIFVTTKLKGG